MTTEIQATPEKRLTGRGSAAGGSRAKVLIARYAALLVIVATFAVFSALSPDAFFTLLTMKSILRDCVPLLVIALGITCILVMNDYDLSVGGLTSLCATLVVVFLSTTYVGMPYPLAIVITL